MNVLAAITLTPGTVISRRTSGQRSASRGDRAVDLRRPRRRGSRPGAGPRRASRARRRAARARPATRGRFTPNRSLTGGRPFRPRISTAWISFFARVRARDQLRRAAPAAGASPASARRASTPRPASPAASSLASVARVEAVGLRPRLADPGVTAGVTTTTRATCGSRIRAISHALPVTSNATQSSRPGSARTAQAPPAASRSGPPSAPSRPPRSRPRRSRDAHPDPIALTTATLLALDDAGEPGGQTTPTDPRSQRNRASRRGGHRKSRARSPSSQNGLPNLRSPRGPCPSHPTLRRARTATLKDAVSCPENRGVPGSSPGLATRKPASLRSTASRSAVALRCSGTRLGTCAPCTSS